MTVAQQASEFLDNLERSRLLTLEEIDAAVEKLDIAEEDAAVLAAKAFVKAGLLTRLQAGRLLEGNCRGFFIDRFKIEEILGSGGMGWVYIARDMHSGERVALKMLCDEGETNAGLLARFKLEARAGMMLNHEAVVRTREIGQTTGLYGQIHYTVMDFVPGVGVDELVTLSKRIKWPLACHIVRHAAAGLHHAHRQGLVHRDVKPANILVDTHANARVLDFGLSLVSQSSEGEEFSLAMIFGHDCLGTADYIAPEQARDSFNIDARADIYGLGATMYYMLAGRVMFPQCHTRQEKVHAQQNLVPPPIRELVPDLPEQVEVILMTMLAKEPSGRFASAKDVCLALEPFARPTNILFNFQQILDRRHAIARQREKLLNDKARREAQATSLTACSLDSQTVRPPQSAVDTTIRKDTSIDGASDSPAGE